MCLTEGYFALLQQNEIEMLLVLSGAALFLVLISWLDEGVELSLYKGQDARAFRVHPFGMWWCLKVADDAVPIDDHPERMMSERMSLLSGSISSPSLKYDSIMASVGGQKDLEFG